MKFFRPPSSESTCPVHLAALQPRVLTAISSPAKLIPTTGVNQSAAASILCPDPLGSGTIMLRHYHVP